MLENIQKESIYRATNVISFPAEEEQILSYWQQERIFENGQQLSKGKSRYTFYDGPPFATGLPHYGHILAGSIKDIVTRYAYQQGCHVERRFGWDCHGLPVEYEIDKLLQIKNPQQVEELGIAKYNEECRKIVMRYSDDWKKIIERVGRWIDFENGYKTMYPWYMESVWWVFKQLYEKGLVYQSVKVMPFSTHCGTALSNFEAGLNYKQVRDPSIIVAFKVIDDLDDSSFLIWTTTPWTLPANLAVCVNPVSLYVKVKDLRRKRFYILGESRLADLFTSTDSYEILRTFQGDSLIGMKYKPVFPYFEKLGIQMNCFQVLGDEYVSSDHGTGIVHQAPYFGEEDYRVCLRNGLISKSTEVICPVDDNGCFTNVITDFAGKYVKDADIEIIRHLKKINCLFSASQVNHSYPYCWRSDTPLIYKAVPSWFIRVEHMREQLLACMAQTHWVPDFVKTNRFGNWLKDAKDWAFSRNRFWGTPIPIWASPDGDEIICIGSMQELELLSGYKVADLHRESIDHITIPSAVKGRPPLRRINSVFDCWFESGSMPLAQKHFPFENTSVFTDSFPADFIAEGIDQTRGWFYTLLVISTALFNKPPFQNLIVGGLVLASDGQKMSKRKQNYPDPMNIVNKYGADALRLYLINSPAVRAENLRFREDGVIDILKEVLIPWYNAYRFLVQNIHRFETGERCDYYYDRKRCFANFENSNVTDVWIISYKEGLLDFFRREMKAYRLYTVVPRLIKFVHQLTNWYIRLNRRRIKGDLGRNETVRAIDVLFEVLSALVKIMAPFVPFFSEYLYLRLSLFESKPRLRSVHYEMMPSCNRTLRNVYIDEAVNGMQKVIELGRMIRNRCGLPLRHPVCEVIIIHRNINYLNSIGSLELYILEELNAKKITLSQNIDEFGIKMHAKPNHKLLGSRLKEKMKVIASEITKLQNTQIEELLKYGQQVLCDEVIEASEVQISFEQLATTVNKFEVQCEENLILLMNVVQDEELHREGIARDIINRIQKLRKKAGLRSSDPTITFYDIQDNNKIQGLRSAIDEHRSFIELAVKSSFLQLKSLNINDFLIAENFELDNMNITIGINRKENVAADFRPTVNVYLSADVQRRYGSERKGTVVLKQPTGKFLTLDEFRNEIDVLFGLYGMNVAMKCNESIISSIETLGGKDVLICHNNN